MTDRDLHQDSSTSVSRNTHRGARVGLAGSLALAGSAFLVACGGGAVKGEKSNLTPDPSVQGIAGAQAQPSTGPEGVTVIVESSPTAVQEAPTVAPTATVEVSNAPKVLAPEELAQAASAASEKIKAGFAGASLPQTNVDSSYIDPSQVTKFLENCANRYDDPKYSNRPDYGAGFIVDCVEAGRATKWLAEHTDGPRKQDFVEANGLIRDIAYTGFTWIEANMPQLGYDAGTWKTDDNLAFIHQ